MQQIETYLTEVFQVSLITRLLESRPCHLGELISNAVQVKLAVLLAFQGLVAFYRLVVLG